MARCATGASVASTITFASRTGIGCISCVACCWIGSALGI